MPAQVSRSLLLWPLSLLSKELKRLRNHPETTNYTIYAASAAKCFLCFGSQKLPLIESQIYHSYDPYEHYSITVVLGFLCAFWSITETAAVSRLV